MDRIERDKWLTADDAGLLAECTVDAYRSRGPGGQHRNKTSTAVRIRHHPTEITVIAEESRSQHENKLRAIRRLRLAIALECRADVGEDWRPPDAFLSACTKAGRIEVNRRNPAYPVVAAAVLDALAAHRGGLREAAGKLGLNTSQLSRFITADGKVLDAANRIRRTGGLKPLARNC